MPELSTSTLLPRHYNVSDQGQLPPSAFWVDNNNPEAMRKLVGSGKLEWQSFDPRKLQAHELNGHQFAEDVQTWPTAPKGSVARLTTERAWWDNAWWDQARATYTEGTETPNWQNRIYPVVYKHVSQKEAKVAAIWDTDTADHSIIERYLQVRKTTHLALGALVTSEHKPTSLIVFPTEITPVKVWR